MKMPKTMAMKITRKNHPVVVALLPKGFAGHPIDRVLGHYVVINKLGIHGELFDNAPPTLAVCNSWMPAKEFHKQYFFIDSKKKNQFVEVEEILP